MRNLQNWRAAYQTCLLRDYHSYQMWFKSIILSFQQIG